MGFFHTLKMRTVIFQCMLNECFAVSGKSNFLTAGNIDERQKICVFNLVSYLVLTLSGAGLNPQVKPSRALFREI